MQLMIRSRRMEAEDVVSLEFVDECGESLPPFTAGAHIDLVLANGCSRSYSLVNDPAERNRYVIAVNRDPASRGGSRYVHEVLQAGQSIEVRGPRNNFELVENAPLVVLFAGGIGVTPLRCMIQRLEALGQPWTLHYAARSRARCAFLDEVAALEARRPGRVHLHFDDEAGGKPMDISTRIAAAPADAHLYCCGPNPMMRAFEAATAGRAPETVHVEYFTAQHDAACEGGFQVVLARSQRTVFVKKGQSILDTLLDAGVDVANCCREGVCGTCQTTVIEGQPDHRDSYLTPPERRTSMMVCCSGSLSDKLVLDL